MLTHGGWVYIMTNRPNGTLYLGVTSDLVPAVPYDEDEVTRVIQDAVDRSIYNEIKDWTVGEFR